MVSRVFDSNCDFCAIAGGDVRGTQIVCEDDNWIAFFPIHPATPGHTLVIPRIHVVNLWEADLDLGAELMRSVIRVGNAIGEAVHPQGMNLITSAGRTAEQSVYHLHLHIVPRWERDGFGRIWPVDGKFDDESLGDVAEKIRAACNG
jgi:histidine triad (HIT) family protein